MAERDASGQDSPDAAIRTRLRDLRVAAVLEVLKAAGARRVLDLGCGDGRLLAALLGDPQFEEVIGVDASAAALDRAAGGCGWMRWRHGARSGSGCSLAR